MFKFLTSWISRVVGLAIVARDRLLEMEERINRLTNRLSDEIEQSSRAYDLLEKAIEQNSRLQENLTLAVDRLDQIISQETPSANATTRRMARIAKETIAEIEEV